MKKSSIALIGFMGTGKTSVGRLLAERTGKQFLELDVFIEEQTGMSVSEIFQREGEIGFREREIAAVKEITPTPDTVIACGGGVVLNTINIDRLRSFCTIVCLTASPETIVRRCCKDGNTRPLFDKEDTETLFRLMRYRAPFYDRAADVTIGTSTVSVPKVVDRIVDRLEKS